jgi:SAM-dependent methyltransferase
MATYDLFSDQSRLYAAYRPTYPEALYRFIMQHVKDRAAAWDCATGNGQVARRLADEFAQVYATDISKKQLDYAYHAPNIQYAIQRAERTSFPDNMFDLITVGQALHWFVLDNFYEEARRVSKPGGVIAAWGYSNVLLRNDVNAIVRDFYENVVGEFWEPARKMVEEHYVNLPFPFEEIQTPEFNIEGEWTVDHLLGYIMSWSATQSYIRKNGDDAVNKLKATLSSCCTPGEKLLIRFPVFLKLGIITK